MSVGVAGLALRRVAEQARGVGIAFDIRLLGEVQIAPVGLGFARERGLEIVVSLGALECCHFVPPE